MFASLEPFCNRTMAMVSIIVLFLVGTWTSQHRLARALYACIYKNMDVDEDLNLILDFKPSWSVSTRVSMML